MVKSVEDYVVVMMLDCKRVTITHRDGGSAIISNMAHTKNSRACSERTTLMRGETRSLQVCDSIMSNKVSNVIRRAQITTTTRFHYKNALKYTLLTNPKVLRSFPEHFYDCVTTGHMRSVFVHKFSCVH